MPTPQELMAQVPYDHRQGGSPAGDAIRNLIQEDAVKKQQASRKFQGQVAQQNAAATQPFQDERSPQAMMQQAGQMQQQQMQQAQQPQQPGQPGQPVQAGPQPPPTAPSAPPPSAPNPQQGPANPQQGPANPGAVPPPESVHVGGAKFQKGRRYV